MVRFTKLLVEGMQKKGHQVQLWAPRPMFTRLSQHAFLKKWLGYLDQYVVFPFTVRRMVRACPANTLYVFTDNALGPWVPLVANCPHVIHCHDFLALRSSLGYVVENPVGWTGRLYQRFIRRGIRRGTYFISDSGKTKDDLEQLIRPEAVASTVEYIGLNAAFTPLVPAEARQALSNQTGLALEAGYLLHVGSEVWYKNRTGVIAIYDALRAQTTHSLPLVMIGHNSTRLLAECRAASPFKNDIYLLEQLDDEGVRLAYAGADVLLFPSLAEGFGWPVAEAMASGCPVITTNEAPMTEVAGKAGYFIARRPENQDEQAQWAAEAAFVVGKVLNLSPVERKKAVEAGLLNAKRFDPSSYIDRIEVTYQQALRSFRN